MLSNTRQPCDEAVVRSQPEVMDCGQATGRWVLAAAILGSSITFIDGTVVNVALPVLQEELGANVAEAQWIVESYALMLAALILVGGSLGDRLGRKRVFSAGVLLFALASVWCGLAPNITQLIVARGVQGVGAALLVPGSLALISASFSKERRGQAIGTWSGFTAIAAGIGPVLGGWLVERFSWRWIFFINIPLSVAVLLIAWRRVPESRDEQTKGRVDWRGATLTTVGLGGIVFGLIESSGRGLTAPLVIASFTLGVAALAGFVFAEAHHEQPMMPLGLLRSPTFAGANLLTLFLYAALGGLLFFLPFNLIQVQGYTATAAGAALLPFVLTMFLLSRWAGGLVERYGSKLPLVVGPVIAAAGFALFALPGAEAGSYWTSFFPAVMVMSIGMTVSVAPLTTTVMGAVEEHHAGVASGINNAVSRTASLLAVAVFGVLMLNAFNSSLAERLNALPVSSEARAQLVGQSTDLANMKIPDEVSGETLVATRQSIRDSFVAGFRLVAYLAAGLAAASALASWLLIEGKARRETEKTFDDERAPFGRQTTEAQSD
ncbi:MAG TPA: MFS transporter [Gemmatimonadaceae bacterium]|nr:MFS transporter [Gemmatimonadaceae bacterium]